MVPGKRDPIFDVTRLAVGSLRFHFQTITSPGRISTIIPRACGITKMSEKIIDASRSNRLSGCIVTSHASLGVRQTSKKSCSLRTSWSERVWKLLTIVCGNDVLRDYTWNSGKYRPACLMTHTGTLSTGSPRAAFSNLSFFSTGKSYRHIPLSVTIYNLNFHWRIPSLLMTLS